MDDKVGLNSVISSTHTLHGEGVREIPFTAPLFTGNNGEGVREIPFTAPLFTGTLCMGKG